MDEISEKTKVFVKSHGMDMITSEEVFEPYTQATAILIAVDKKRQEGWYMDIEKTVFVFTWMQIDEKMFGYRLAYAL